MPRISHRSPVPLILAAAFGLLQPLAAAGEVSTKYDRDADFSKYRVYDWAAALKKPEGSPMAVGGEADTTIRNAIDQQLQAQGFRPAIDEEPDFLVAYDGAMESVTDFEGLREDIAGGVAWVMEGSIHSYRQGTLMITVRDAESERTVWSASTREKVKDPQNPDKQIQKAVKKLLKKFPPRN